jgi:RNA recognition motif-containing protein
LSKKQKKKMAAEQLKAKTAGQQPAVGQKRKTDDVAPTTSKQPKLANNDAVLGEEDRRRHDRDERSLYVKGFPKGTSQSDLKALHPDIIGVRLMPERTFAWVMFTTTDACNKAFSAVSKAKISGKELTVDYCGQQSKTYKDRMTSAKATDGLAKKPVNPLELFVAGYPPNTTTDQIKILFPNCVSVSLPTPKKSGNKKFCFVKFANDADAAAAFEKGKNVKIGGTPVDVMYARLKQPREK